MAGRLKDPVDMPIFGVTVCVTLADSQGDISNLDGKELDAPQHERT